MNFDAFLRKGFAEQFPHRLQVWRNRSPVKAPLTGFRPDDDGRGALRFRLKQQFAAADPHRIDNLRIAGRDPSDVFGIIENHAATRHEIDGFRARAAGALGLDAELLEPEAKTATVASIVEHAVEATAPEIAQAKHCLTVSVPEQEIWLKRALEKGTRRLGRDEPKKLATGRILMHADFGDLARQYLPAPAQAGQIADDEAREEIVKGHLTVRAAETLVKRLKANRQVKQPKPADPHLVDTIHETELRNG